jgi:hypothetical protein
MTLSSALVGALKSFNEMDPMARSGMLPVADGLDFLNRVMSSPSDQTRVSAGGSPPAQREIELSSKTKRQMVEASGGDSIQNAKDGSIRLFAAGNGSELNECPH